MSSSNHRSGGGSSRKRLAPTDVPQNTNVDQPAEGGPCANTRGQKARRESVHAQVPPQLAVQEATPEPDAMQDIVETAPPTQRRVACPLRLAVSPGAISRWRLSTATASSPSGGRSTSVSRTALTWPRCSSPARTSSRCSPGSVSTVCRVRRSVLCSSAYAARSDQPGYRAEVRPCVYGQPGRPHCVEPVPSHHRSWDEEQHPVL